MQKLKNWLEENDIKYREGKTINKTPLFNIYFYPRDNTLKNKIIDYLDNYDKELTYTTNKYRGNNIMVYESDWEEQ